MLFPNQTILELKDGWKKLKKTSETFQKLQISPCIEQKGFYTVAREWDKHLPV